MRNIFIKIVKRIHKSFNNLLNGMPNARSLINKLYDEIRIVVYKFNRHISKNERENNILYVNPNKIIYEKDVSGNNWLFLYKFLKPLLFLSSFQTITIIHGDWDLKENLGLFNENIEYKSYYQHFLKGMSWEKTQYYKRESRLYLDGIARKQYNSIDELDLRYKYLDYLFKKIRVKGLKTQREIIKSEGFKYNYGRGIMIRKSDDDISVAIGRKGDLIFLDGRHRLNIAKILNLRKIPIRILIVHQEFINKLKKKLLKSSL